MHEVTRETITTDVLIIGGGTAGCLAAVEARAQNPRLRVTVLEKAHLDRSGCLAAGMNAINLYLHPGETPESLVKYVRYDACGLLREDLVLSAAQEVNAVVRRVESWGLPIQKDAQGRYAARGRWNLKVNGESLKPILARAVRESGAEVRNRVVVTNLLLREGRVIGAVGFGVRDGRFYVVRAKTTLMATGGAAGVYRPNNDGPAHHKIWYCPFNTGAGYAMGIRAGAEMTSLEMRFVALRTKDILSPTGTLALGFGARLVNAQGEEFMSRRWAHVGGEGSPTCYRVYAPLLEQKEGHGPCYLDTRGLSPERVRELQAAFLDMYPGIVLYWAANRFDPGQEPVEIAGTEPYIVGGHCQAGYWIDPARRTTLPGLYAAGDVAGGMSYKFVSGCWAEGVIAARAAVQEAAGLDEVEPEEEQVQAELRRTFAPLQRYQEAEEGITPQEMEERLQKIMDEYAGGISAFYELHEASLLAARQQVKRLKEQTPYLIARDLHELMLAHEVLDRIDLAETLVEHLLYRQETRWPGFQTRVDYPYRDDFNWLKFVNSRRNPTTGQLEVFTRPYEQLVPGDRYLPD